MGSSSSEEHHDIVIVGGGICGLATALALHRKGIGSLVLEKSDELRAAGAAIGVYVNAWHALDQLGVGTILRSKSIAISEMQEVWLQKNTTQITPCRKEDFRCLKRSDLIETLAESLPGESIRFGCHIVAVDKDHQTSYPTLYIDDGSIIKAKVVIGCDGSNSVIASSLGLGPPRLLSNYVVRGLTAYPNGHNVSNIFLRMWDGNMIFGRIPIDDNLVHWFADWNYPPKDSELGKDPKLMRDVVIESIKGYPSEMIEMVECCDLSSLSLSRIRYRAPWHLLFAGFWKGTTTVAGDAMHVMGPFLGQGGAAALEDAVVIGRCLAEAMHAGPEGEEVGDRELQKRVGAALRKYVKERKLRVLRLSLQSYLLSCLLAPSRAVRFVSLVLLMALFGGGFSLSHTGYNCGRL